MGPLIDELAAVLADRSDRPFAFFGHSMGGRIAFELASALERRGARGPVHLFLSSTVEPTTMSPEAKTSHLLPDEAFEAYALSFGGIPPELHRRRSHMDRLLALLRADLELNYTAAFEPGAPLGCPLTVLGGRDDVVSREPHLSAWRAHTRGELSMHLFDGGHFYLVEQRDAVLACVAAALAPYVASAEGSQQG